MIDFLSLQFAGLDGASDPFPVPKVAVGTVAGISWWCHEPAVERRCR
jgi:hypothetical protein